MRGSRIAVAVAATALITVLSGGAAMATVTHGPPGTEASPAQALATATATAHQSITPAAIRAAGLEIAEATGHKPAPAQPAPGKLQGQTVLITCLNRPVVQPYFFMLACGDGTAFLARLRWSSWTSLLASGTGQFSLNPCHPSCARGKFITSPVAVMLWHPAAVPHRPTRQQFLRITIIYTGSRPAGAQRFFTESLWPPTPR